jgi:hypothetical protein
VSMSDRGQSTRSLLVTKLAQYHFHVRETGCDRDHVTPLAAVSRTVA